MQLETIDVTGLPRPVVADIQKLVESIRNNLPAAPAGSSAPSPVVELPRWQGTVLGVLTRRELYDDVG
jgi:hypothetical protein